MPHGLQEPAQPLFLQGYQVLLDCFGWVLEARSVLLHRRADPLDIEVQASYTTVKRFTSVAHTQLLGLGSQLIEGRGALLVDGVLVGHQVGECAVGSRVR